MHEGRTDRRRSRWPSAMRWRPSAGSRDAIPVLSRGIAELRPPMDAELRASLEAARLSAARWEPTAQALRRELATRSRSVRNAGERLDRRLHGQLAIETTARGTDRGGASATLRGARRENAPGSRRRRCCLRRCSCWSSPSSPTKPELAIEEWLALRAAHACLSRVCSVRHVATLAALYRGAVSDAVAHALADAVVPEVAIRLAPISVAFWWRHSRSEENSRSASLRAHRAWAGRRPAARRGPSTPAAAGGTAARGRGRTPAAIARPVWRAASAARHGGCRTRRCTHGDQAPRSRSRRLDERERRSRSPHEELDSLVAGVRRERSALPSAPESPTTGERPRALREAVNDLESSQARSSTPGTGRPGRCAAPRRTSRRGSRAAAATDSMSPTALAGSRWRIAPGRS